MNESTNIDTPGTHPHSEYAIGESVSEGMDDGEIIAQRCLPILKTDTFESYKKRVHAVEHEIYPEAVLEALGLS
jgi:phosphoribosylglycinamide formyltransferase-1